MKKSQTILVFIVSSCLLLAGCAEYVALEIAGAVINNSSNKKSSNTKSSKTKGEASPISTYAMRVTNIDNNTICEYATYSSNLSGITAIEWANNKKYVAEAKRRGLSCGVLDSSSTQVASITSSKICESATYRLVLSGNVVIKWASEFPQSKEYVAEAKRRGLSCGVKGSGSTQVQSNVFKSFTDRKILYLCNYGCTK